MTPRRELKFGAFMRPASIHTASWRYPGGLPDANFNFEHHLRFARTLERGLFDALFMADHLAVLNMPMAALMRSATVTSFDPLTLLPALATATRHLGLIATASTSYNEPYHIARKFASLDHLSGGRAGWNVVTSANPHEAHNFGREEHLDHADRYRRAREFHAVVTGLWDSWADDAFLHDVERGIFFDPARLHVLDHQGEFFRVRGPLNIARPVQGYPVIVQAGSSEEGKELAAETAEMIFSANITLESARDFYRDVKARMAGYGREPDSLKVMPGAFIVLAATAEEAKRRKSLLDSLVHPDSGVSSLSVMLGHDVSHLDLDGPLPEIPESNASKSSRDKIIERARLENLSVRQLAQWIGGSYGILEMVGTPSQVADQMQAWFEAEAADGFNIMFSHLPGGMEDVVDTLIPELQRRNLYRRAYAGPTLRDQLGLSRPTNRFFPAPRGRPAQE